MKRIYSIMMCLMALAFVGCNEDFNDWPVDESYNRPFRPATFELGEAQPTSLQLTYTGVKNAKTYVFDFAEVKLPGSEKLPGGTIVYDGDMSGFYDNVVRTVNILADTLTTLSTTTSEASREYNTWFQDLKGLTVYAIRMKAVTEDGAESKYAELLVKTPPEQIFKKIVGGLDKATLFWTASKEVTHFRYGEMSEDYSDTTWVDGNVNLDASGKYVLSGLTSGTQYIAEIYNVDNLRGTLNFKTLGLKPSGTVGTITIAGSMDVNAAMAESVAAGQTDLQVIFKAGAYIHDFAGKINIPAGATSAYFIGDIEAEGALPEVRAKELKIGSTLTKLSFQYIDLNGCHDAGFFMNLNGNPFEEMEAEGCIIRNMNNCLLRFSGDMQGAIVKNISLRDCELFELSTGGWGVINFNFNNGEVQKISITNCTIRDIADQLMDIRNVVANIIIDRCILCNYNYSLPKVFLLGKQPSEISVTNNIFCGDNKNQKIDYGYGDYKYLDFVSNYKTSELTINKRPFANITELEMTAEDLFVNPRNGDFHIKPGVRFPGDGTAGPSKWWTEK